MMRAYVYGDRCISSTGKSCGNDLENHDDELEPEISGHGAALLGLGLKSAGQNTIAFANVFKLPAWAKVSPVAGFSDVRYLPKIKLGNWHDVVNHPSTFSKVVPRHLILKLLLKPLD
jgi:hypothetical protein